MPNIPYPSSHDDPRVDHVLSRVPQLNLLKLESWAEGVVESIVRVSDGVLRRSEVDPILRQVAVLRLCAVVGSEYEFHHLVGVSKRHEISDELIEAARVGSSSPRLSEIQVMVARLAEELAVSPRPSKEVFDYLKSKLSSRHLMELVISVGFYLMQSRVIETFDIELESESVDLTASDIDEAALQAWRNGTE